MNKELILRALENYKEYLWKILRINRLDGETEVEYMRVLHAIEDLTKEKSELPKKKISKGLLEELMQNAESTIDDLPTPF